MFGVTSAQSEFELGGKKPIYLFDLSHLIRVTKNFFETFEDKQIHLGPFFIIFMSKANSNVIDWPQTHQITSNFEKM